VAGLKGGFQVGDRGELGRGRAGTFAVAGFGFSLGFGDFLGNAG